MLSIGKQRRCRTDRAASRGSATVEFIVMAPFFLMLIGMIWDMRAYIAMHTKAAREMYVVAEVIASEIGPDTGSSPIERVTSEVIDRLEDDGAGKITIALVRRGDRRLATAANPDPVCAGIGVWCLPLVAAVWPPASQPGLGTWNGGGDCAAYQPLLPAVGDHFPAGQPVLPNEVPPGVTPPPTQSSWVSRNLRHEEWWVVVDSCFHPDVGLFGGIVLRGIAFFDVSRSALVLYKRAAWGSIHDYSWCNWCP